MSYIIRLLLSPNISALTFLVSYVFEVFERSKRISFSYCEVRWWKVETIENMSLKGYVSYRAYKIFNVAGKGGYFIEGREGISVNN